MSSLGYLTPIVTTKSPFSIKLLGCSDVDGSGGEGGGGRGRRPSLG